MDSSDGSVTANSSNGERDDAPATEEDETPVDTDWLQDGHIDTAANADELGPFRSGGDDPLEVDDGSLTTGSERERTDDDGAIDDTTDDGATDDEGGLFDEDFGSALEGVSEPSKGGEDVGPEGFSELDFGLKGADKPDFDEEIDSELPRLDLGINGLDRMIQGGVPERSLIVAMGSAGTGKPRSDCSFSSTACPRVRTRCSSPSKRAASG